MTSQPAAATTARRDGDVLVVEMTTEYLTNETLDAWDAALEQLATDTSLTAMVSVGSGKFYTNGLDLAGMQANPGGAGAYVDRVQRLLARVLALDVPTAAAVNGHAFGAGAMLAVAHDIAVMRADRGYWCLPEVDLGLPFTPLMSALVRAKLPAATAYDAMFTGRRYGGDAAAAAGIVAGAAAEDAVLVTALDAVRARAGKSRAALGAIKADVFSAALQHAPAPPSAG